MARLASSVLRPAAGFAEGDGHLLVVAGQSGADDDPVAEPDVADAIAVAVAALAGDDRPRRQDRADAARALLEPADRQVVGRLAESAVVRPVPAGTAAARPSDPDGPPPAYASRRAAGRASAGTRSRPPSIRRGAPGRPLPWR